MIETPPVTSRACVMIPTYNHFKFLPAVIEKVRQQGLPVIVVDDGSTDSSQSFLSGLTDIEVITFSKNRGKGSALAAGLRRAGKRGYALAVCIDADGQHDPKDIPRMIAAAKNRLDTLVIGAREYGQETAPRKSRFGRVFSNFWIWIETGKNMADTQSGFRLYPVAAMNQLKIRASRYGWEVEALARAVWGGLQVISIPVAVSYAAKKDSHFRVGRDFFLVSCTNAYLVLRRLMPFGFRKVVTQEKVVWPKSWKEKSRFLWQHYLWQTDQTPGEKALAIGIGVFCGIIPIWGWQTLFAIYLAQRLHLNKVLTLVGANISIPPMIPGIIYLSMVLGRFALSNEWRWQLPLSGLTMEAARMYLKEFVIGSSILAIIAGILIGILSYGMFHYVEKKANSA